MGLFKSLLARLGRHGADPVVSVPPSPGAGAPAPDDDDDEHQPDDDAALEAWDDLQMFIQRCEVEALDLAGLDLADPATFVARQARIERLQVEGRSYRHSVVAAGFASVEHWEQVCRYYQARWSRLVQRSDGGREICLCEEFKAAADASVGVAPKVDPRALEPVRGVSLERWARASAVLAHLSAHAGDAEIDAALAPFGLDRASYGVINGIWQDRMRNDASLTIAARFGAACDDGESS